MPPVTVTLAIHNTDTEDSLICFKCQERLKHGERYHHWGIQFEKEFVQCSFHRVPTKKLIGLTVLYSFGFEDTWSTSTTFRISRVNRRGKILNPATPSYFSLAHLFELYETPTKQNVARLIDAHCIANPLWPTKAEAEFLTKEINKGEDGIRRGVRVLTLERSCTNCGVSEAVTVAKNPKYTLCRGVCVVCYRKLYRKKVEA